MEPHPLQSDPQPVPWVVVAGGVHRFGGTDKANFALVQYLLSRGISVHLVTHKVDRDLARHPNLHLVRVPLPANSWFAGGRLLSIQGRRVAARIVQENPQARVVVNGGNCIWPDINWVHYVHHAWSGRPAAGSPLRRLKARLFTALAKRRETAGLSAARVVITNSELTRAHVIRFTAADPARVQTVYLGAETDWVPPAPQDRQAARRWLGQPDGRPLVAFVGGIGNDGRKGLDVLWRAWQRLAANKAWDGHLLIAGDGPELPRWRDTVSRSGIAHTVRFLSPARYESYGLNVQEALCRGVPAIVSAGAGVAERYPPELRHWLLPDPEDPGDLAGRLLRWRADQTRWREQALQFSQELRHYGWREMAERFYCLATQTGGPPPGLGRTLSELPV
jgi:glycosyltransferase involved in cell wall biosynthesis